MVWYLGSNLGAFGAGFRGGATQRRAISLEFSKNQTLNTLANGMSHTHKYAKQIETNENKRYWLYLGKLESMHSMWTCWAG
jgi:hypothetical protein